MIRFECSNLHRRNRETTAQQLSIMFSKISVNLVDPVGTTSR